MRTLSSDGSTLSVLPSHLTVSRYPYRPVGSACHAVYAKRAIEIARKVLAKPIMQFRKQGMMKRSTGKGAQGLPKYVDEQLDAACAHVLPKLTPPRYRHIKAILDSNLEVPPSICRKPATPA